MKTTLEILIQPDGKIAIDALGFSVSGTGGAVYAGRCQLVDSGG
jgi:hypothetical protein